MTISELAKLLEGYEIREEITYRAMPTRLTHKELTRDPLPEVPGITVGESTDVNVWKRATRGDGQNEKQIAKLYLVEGPKPQQIRMALPARDALWSDVAPLVKAGFYLSGMEVK